MQHQNGMTITELMVAVAIGLIVSAAVAGVFLQAKASYMQNDEISFMQDNGRYALKILTNDLEMSEFWGGMAAADRSSIDTNNDGSFTVTGVVDAIDETATGCGDGTANWDYDITSPIAYQENTTSTAIAAVFSCVASIDDNTDVLMIKRAAGVSYSAASDLQTDQVYIRTNRSTASLHRQDGATADPAAGYFDWPYLVHIYYVESGLLKRMSLGASDIYSKDILADGIELFHIEWGIDSDNDGAVDFFTRTPTAAQIDQAIVAKVYVLARSSKTITGYTNTKTFVMGNHTVGPFDDGYYRRVFSTTVVMRNPETVQQFN
jgi:type IV pilus assembly protein PilW